MPETYAFERSKDMRKKKVTSSDIAHAAGVSQATVSMILNKKYNVSFSKETIRKVEQIAEEMGYEVPKRKTRRESRKEKLDRKSTRLNSSHRLESRMPSSA